MTKIILVKGATMYEAQFGRLWLRLMRPRFMNRRSWPWFRISIIAAALAILGCENPIEHFGDEPAKDTKIVLPTCRFDTLTKIDTVCHVERP